MEPDKHIGLLISQHLLEEKSEADETDLQLWLAESDANRNIFRLYKQIWDESQHYMEKTIFNTDTAWKRINEINRQKAKKLSQLTKTLYAVSGIAASLLIFLVASQTGLLRETHPVSMSITADYGSQSNVILPDGTGVELNSGSELTYTESKDHQSRQVLFKGEGFFNVTKSKKPFIIELADGVQVKVLGTTFNLRAYPDDLTIQASLLEGSIELSHASDNLTLHPGDIAVFDKNTQSLKQVRGTLSHTYGWLDNKLYMDNMSLLDVCKFLERRYKVTITIPVELGEKIHYTGVLQEENIIETLEALRSLSDIKYETKGNIIKITSKR